MNPTTIATDPRQPVDVCRVHRFVRSEASVVLSSWLVDGIGARSALMIDPPELARDKYTGVTVPGRRGAT